MVLGFIWNVEDKDPLHRYATNELVGQHLEKGIVLLFCFLVVEILRFFRIYSKIAASVILSLIS